MDSIILTDVLFLYLLLYFTAGDAVRPQNSAFLPAARIRQIRM